MTERSSVDEKAYSRVHDSKEGNTLHLDPTGLDITIVVKEEPSFYNVPGMIEDRSFSITEAHTFKSPQPSECIRIEIRIHSDHSGSVCWPTKKSKKCKHYPTILLTLQYAEDKFVALLSAHISQLNAPLKEHWTSTCWLTSSKWTYLRHFLKEQFQDLNIVPEKEYQDRRAARDRAFICEHLLIARQSAKELGIDTTLYDKLIEEVKPQKKESEPK